MNINQPYPFREPLTLLFDSVYTAMPPPTRQARKLADANLNQADRNSQKRDVPSRKVGCPDRFPGS
jgi:hypothetical protein